MNNDGVCPSSSEDLLDSTNQFKRVRFKHGGELCAHVDGKNLYGSVFIRI